MIRGTIDDCELVEGLVLTQRLANTGVTRVEKAKIGLIQFCLSPPKTDVSHLTNMKYEYFLNALNWLMLNFKKNAGFGSVLKQQSSVFIVAK